MGEGAIPRDQSGCFAGDEILGSIRSDVFVEINCFCQLKSTPSSYCGVVPFLGCCLTTKGLMSSHLEDGGSNPNPDDCQAPDRQTV